jgi:hypothetical protein
MACCGDSFTLAYVLYYKYRSVQTSQREQYHQTTQMEETV